MIKGFNQYKTVLKKEMVDAFRDKRSIFASFILPIILFPILFLLMGDGMNNVTQKALNPTVAVVTASQEGYNSVDMNSETELSTYIKNQVLANAKSLNMTITYVNSNQISKDLANGDITIVLVIEPNIIEIIETEQETAPIALIYDERSTVSTSCASVLNNVIAIFDQTKTSERLTSYPDLNIYPTLISQVTLSSAFPDLERTGTNSELLLVLLPMLIVLLISIGGANMAVDLVAGERERNTFEPLLSTSASRFSILSAKFTVVIIFSFLTAICEIIAILISSIISPSSNSLFGAISGMTLSPLATILAVLNVFILCALLSSAYLFLTSSAKTVKEANAKTLILTLLPMVIAYATIYLEVNSVPLLTSLIPIYNVLVSIKTVLAGVINYPYLISSLIVNIVYAGIAIFITLKSFSRESIITK